MIQESKGEAMEYKRLGDTFSFADLAVRKSQEHNRSLKMMERINKVDNWRNVEALLFCLRGYNISFFQEFNFSTVEDGLKQTRFLEY